MPKNNSPLKKSRPKLKTPQSDEVWEKTRKAYHVWMKGFETRLKAWHKADTIAALKACKEADTAALVPMREAFYEATKASNRKQDCMRASIHTLVRAIGMVGHYQIETTKAYLKVFSK